ncbi:hypothetical protein C2E25_10880 [Geothermobacter hydrogeniphilus]|uniref:Uncharacterized protein n=1 Tax=Geothermobacter hydrogeniphilus TaxID=1969733 RepID=A0A2K2H927_9BACT|nr:hypothetical protein [Geothermobacter hydrogeniphilus]PNU19806.1 hypothetical protein C2E25_10880 [Geothermobacter hydrogeniphilus]
MDIRATLKPGQNGTKELTRRYGDRLVCVRYRYDKVRRMRYKTVELIVEAKPWIPPYTEGPARKVLIQVSYGETELRKKVKAIGGLWDPVKKAWVLQLQQVRDLKLEKRIVQTPEKLEF